MAELLKTVRIVEGDSDDTIESTTACDGCNLYRGTCENYGKGVAEFDAYKCGVAKAAFSRNKAFNGSDMMGTDMEVVEDTDPRRRAGSGEVIVDIRPKA